LNEIEFKETFLIRTCRTGKGVGWAPVKWLFYDGCRSPYL